MLLPRGVVNSSGGAGGGVSASWQHGLGSAAANQVVCCKNRDFLWKPEVEQQFAGASTSALSRLSRGKTPAVSQAGRLQSAEKSQSWFSRVLSLPASSKRRGGWSRQRPPPRLLLQGKGFLRTPASHPRPP